MLSFFLCTRCVYIEKNIYCANVRNMLKKSAMKRGRERYVKKLTYQKRLFKEMVFLKIKFFINHS